MTSLIGWGKKLFQPQKEKEQIKMKVKAIKNYYDLVLQKEIKEGEVIEMPEERAAELSTEKNKARMKLVEIMEDTAAEPKSETKEDTAAEPESGLVSDSDTEKEKKEQLKRRGGKTKKVEEPE